MLDRRIFTVLAGAAFVAPGVAASAGRSLHDFSFTAIEGGPMPLSAFAGRPVLLVNTASFCGFTPQFRALQALWTDYRDRGLIVLAAPSGDFGGQEHGTAEEAQAFCDAAYGVDFPMTDLVHVRGPNAHPVYRWLADAMGGPGRPSWNFHKILIGADGAPLAGFPSRIRPDDPRLVAAVEQALAP